MDTPDDLLRAIRAAQAERTLGEEAMVGITPWLDAKCISYIAALGEADPQLVHECRKDKGNAILSADKDFSPQGCAQIIDFTRDAIRVVSPDLLWKRGGAFHGLHPDTVLQIFCCGGRTDFHQWLIRGVTVPKMLEAAREMHRADGVAEGEPLTPEQVVGAILKATEKVASRCRGMLAGPGAPDCKDVTEEFLMEAMRYGLAVVQNAPVLEELPRDAQGVRRFWLEWPNADRTHGWTTQQLLKLHFAVPAVIAADVNMDLISAIGSGERRSLPIGPGKPGEGTCPQLRFLSPHSNAWRPLWGDYTPVASPLVSVVEEVPGLVEELGIDAELLAVSSLRRMDGGVRPVLQGPSWRLFAASCPDLTPGADAGSSVTRELAGTTSEFCADIGSAGVIRFVVHASQSGLRQTLIEWHSGPPAAAGVFALLRSPDGHLQLRMLPAADEGIVSEVNAAIDSSLKALQGWTSGFDGRYSIGMRQLLQRYVSDLGTRTQLMLPEGLVAQLPAKVDVQVDNCNLGTGAVFGSHLQGKIMDCFMHALQLVAPPDADVQLQYVEGALVFDILSEPPLSAQQLDELVQLVSPPPLYRVIEGNSVAFDVSVEDGPQFMSSKSFQMSAGDAAVLGFHAPAAPGDPPLRYPLLFRGYKVNTILARMMQQGVQLRGLQAALQDLSDVLDSSRDRFTLTPAAKGMCSIAFPASTMSAEQQDQEAKKLGASYKPPGAGQACTKHLVHAEALALSNSDAVRGPLVVRSGGLLLTDEAARWLLRQTDSVRQLPLQLRTGVSLYVGNQDAGCCSFMPGEYNTAWLTGCTALLEEVQHQVSNAAAAAETAGRQLEVVLRRYSEGEHAIELSVPGVLLHASKIAERVRAATDTWHASGDQALLSLEAVGATMATCASLLRVKGALMDVMHRAEFNLHNLPQPVDVHIGEAVVTAKVSDWSHNGKMAISGADFTHALSAAVAQLNTPRRHSTAVTPLAGKHSSGGYGSTSFEGDDVAADSQGDAGGAGADDGSDTSGDAVTSGGQAVFLTLRARGPGELDLGLMIDGQPLPVDGQQVQKYLDDSDVTRWRVVPDKPHAISRLLEDAMTLERLQLKGAPGIAIGLINGDHLAADSYQVTVGGELVAEPITFPASATPANALLHRTRWRPMVGALASAVQADQRDSHDAVLQAPHVVLSGTPPDVGTTTFTLDIWVNELPQERAAKVAADVRARQPAPPNWEQRPALDGCDASYRRALAAGSHKMLHFGGTKVATDLGLPLKQANLGKRKKHGKSNFHNKPGEGAAPACAFIIGGRSFLTGCRAFGVGPAQQGCTVKNGQAADVIAALRAAAPRADSSCAGPAAADSANAAPAAEDSNATLVVSRPTAPAAATAATAAAAPSPKLLWLRLDVSADGESVSDAEVLAALAARGVEPSADADVAAAIKASDAAGTQTAVATAAEAVQPDAAATAANTAAAAAAEEPGGATQQVSAAPAPSAARESGHGGASKPGRRGSYNQRQMDELRRQAGPAPAKRRRPNYTGLDEG